MAGGVILQEWQRMAGGGGMARREGMGDGKLQGMALYSQGMAFDVRNGIWHNGWQFGKGMALRPKKKIVTLAPEMAL